MLQSIDTLAQLKAIRFSIFDEVFCKATGREYFFKEDSGLTPDDLEIVLPVQGGNWRLVAKTGNASEGGEGVGGAFSLGDYVDKTADRALNGIHNPSATKHTLVIITITFDDVTSGQAVHIAHDGQIIARLDSNLSGAGSQRLSATLICKPNKNYEIRDASVDTPPAIYKVYEAEIG